MKIFMFFLSCCLFFKVVHSGINRSERSTQYIFPEDKQSCELIRLISYNIRGESLLDRQHSNFWDIRKYKVQYLLQRYQPDIIGFQGVSACCVSDILDLFPEYLCVSFDTNNQGDKDVALLVKANRFDILKADYFWLNQNPLERMIPSNVSWGTRKPRIVVHAILQDNKTNKRVAVFCTHFDSSGIEARVKSVQTIMELHSQIALDLPAIIMGDFNFILNASFPELIQKTEDAYGCFVDNDYWFDIRDIAQTKHYGPDGSWIGWSYDKYGVKKGSVGERLDHVFVKKCCVMSEGVLQLKVNSSCDGLFFPFDNCFDEILYPSDHLPIIADIVVQ